jgi:hypothetical protein
MASSIYGSSRVVGAIPGPQFFVQVVLYKLDLLFKICKRLQFLILIVFLTISYAINTWNSLISEDDNMLLLFLGVGYVENQHEMPTEYPWVIFVTHVAKVNKCQPVVVDIQRFNPLALKHRDPKISSIAKFPYSIYVAIVTNCMTICVHGLYPNATIW